MTATTSAVTLEEKLENLEEILRSLGRVLVGYSGGVDSAMLAVAAFAEGESRFYGIGNLRDKECDRISGPVKEFKRIGIDCDEGAGEVVIRGNPDGYEGGIEMPTHHDHRVAQMLAIVGLRCRRGLTLLDAQTVGKSYPAFFDDLIRLGANIELED